jgi:hypothetical protein
MINVAILSLVFFSVVIIVTGASVFTCLPGHMTLIIYFYLFLCKHVTRTGANHIVVILNLSLFLNPVSFNIASRWNSTWYERTAIWIVIVPLLQLVFNVGVGFGVKLFKKLQ